ncbi:transcription elongation factor GreA [Desulfonispora thiosulfatigenes DSM 11270]|uniref:Transcription elongation factor GreA n=1 Tax=Desulfonispora thiosulfatigenes DSM 11270 TaxID=656914 RepID=A0A1W1UUT8_DESTI|nr:transcription elongation factor GreA [Desulfonispora thiosulfatigenes]SMB84581.1 transcription elongation factor GreA [Desulfonispora thiosulfatigenes DSM 11270]
MTEKEVILTQEGFEKLENEVEHLKTVRRKEVAERLKQAIDFGDISENSEYDDAKHEQAFIEGRIIEIEKLLRSAKIIQNDDRQAGIVSVGSVVCLKDLEFDEELEYTIVGSAEANPLEDKISNESPVGSGLLGQSVGSVVEIEVPAGKIKLEILDVKN